jgi:hypothetical protein
MYKNSKNLRDGVTIQAQIDQLASVEDELVD